MMKKIVLTCLLVAILTACGTGKDNMEAPIEMNEQLLGSWEENIEIPQSPLPIIIKLDRETGSLSVPAQGLHDIPFKSAVYIGDEMNVVIDLTGSKIQITGQLKGERIEGVFKQNGQTFPIALARYEEQPVTYEELSIPVSNGELKAALQRAGKDGPTPVVILLAGSGATDKDGNPIGGAKNDSLKMLAEGLALLRSG